MVTIHSPSGAMMLNIAVIIPTLNGEQDLQQVLLRLVNALEPNQIWIIDLKALEKVDISTGIPA
jgi:hypothetical protein